MKNKWSNYALKDGKVQSSYIREYSSRSPKRQAREASCRNRLLQSGEKQPEAEKEVELVYREPTHYRVNVDPIILNDAWVVNLRKQDESSREEDVGEAHQQGRQGIQSSDQGRCEAEERSDEIKTREEEKMKKEKITPKEKKHEARESKSYEKMEDKKEAKKEMKVKKK